jgi:hypothetical protein
LHTKRAFTRVELIFTITAALLILSVFLAVPRWRAQRDLEGCKHNLKVVALAYHLWFIDHEEYGKPPWLTPVAHNGTKDFEPAARRSECWFQMMCLSNELRSPRFLVDPADKGARIATTWEAAPQSGFAAPQFQDNACSYGVGVDQGSYSWWIPPTRSLNSLLFVDRHLQANSGPEQCSAGLAATGFKQPFAIWWSRALHGPKSATWL